MRPWLLFFKRNKETAIIKEVSNKSNKNSMLEN